jgi:tRNA nucleotidyltransferase (CCA-adding enzyme)
MSVILILTHENADFDAVAAQLAAAKLTPSAVPVLPRRVNRNVQRFLTLYGRNLPFIQADQLKRRHVDRVVVVDTQSFVTVRGMRPDTPVQIIDHHPLAKELEPHQQYSGEPLGATTTLLVEQLRAENGTLSPVEATMLLLGIYEDTGSLLYGTTTPRDLLAAAWLLERGADLDIVGTFLEHTLTEDQQRLYNLLLAGAQTVEIGGYVILVAAAAVDHVVEEISSLVHKLRETYDATAIVVLVAMEDYVQLIARSVSEDIDVGQIADRFGGGGHGRAAAAQIRDLPLNEVQARLVEILPDLVRPSARVAELMSQRVQAIDADETIETAAIRMQRSGHEGYPVLSGGRVVGLLTRRAVDRAMNHGLGSKPVSQIMDNGVVTVQPDDSIEALQQAMMQSGWGQVPVVDGEGHLIGIVTRTDLIKRWGQPAEPDKRSGQIVRQMHTTLPAGLIVLLETIAAEAQSRNVGLYAIGGFVRDLLLGMPNLDIDLVVEDNAIELAQALHAKYGGEIHPHRAFVTATWKLSAEVAQRLNANFAEWPPFIDFATARREFYEEPAALPTVEPGSIKLDLRRRDFTINALAIRLSPAPFGKLLDFYGGERDLRQKIIRVLDNLSFIDDATRMLRAVRFEQRLGFQIEPNTEALFADALPYIQRVSGERLRHEIDLILAERQPELALRRLHDIGVLREINEDLIFDGWLGSAFLAVREGVKAFEVDNLDLTLAHIYWNLLACRLGNLPNLIARLQIDRALADQLEHGRRAYLAMPELSSEQRPSAVVETLDGLADNALMAAWAMAPTRQARDTVVAYIRQWRHVHPSLTGDDLIAMGLKPGPMFGKLLRHLRRAKLDEGLITGEQERAYLHQLIRRWADERDHDGD